MRIAIGPMSAALALAACGRVDFNSASADASANGSSDGNSATTSPQLLAHTTATAVGDTATTPAIATNGASLLVAVVVGYLDSTLAVTDELANTWTPLALVGPSDGGNGTGTTVTQIFYVASPTGALADTFTATASNTFATVSVTAWTGTSTSTMNALDAQAVGGNADGRATFSPGSIAPSATGELVIAALGSNNNYSTNLATIDITSPFEIIDGLLNPAGETMVVAYDVTTTTATLDPSWTMGPDATTAVAAMAAFR